MKKQTILIILALAFVAIMIFFASNSGPKKPNDNKTNNPPVEAVQIVDGKQIIDVTARGGYRPKEIVAKADTPTVLRVKTSGTFDCSLAFTIPSLNIQKMLPQTGITEFDIPPQKSGSSLIATCSMGMYNMKINFQ